MGKFSFASVRLGKTSVDDIKRINNFEPGILEAPIQINVVCTQVPQELEKGHYVFLWLGSDNSKGAPTEWKQGFKSFGRVDAVSKGEKYNDESTTTISILYVFGDAINRLDILRESPECYFWCSSMPIIGLDDHSNQTIRMMESENSRCNINAFFSVICDVCYEFKQDIVKIDEGFRDYLDFIIPNPKNYKTEESLSNVVFEHKKDIGTSSALNSYLTAIRTKPFLLLAGISGTGKSRIVRKLAQATDNIDTFTNPEDRWRLHSPANFELIQVKPNWHNSMDVVGFKSNIGNNGEHYEFTPFVEFIAKAWKYEDTPFFLCLDEMNLAPVEEYFAEFLSAIESRSLNDNSYETDPIIKPFREFGEKVAIEMIDHLLGEKMANLDDDSQLSHVGWRFLNKGLTLPRNLIVMGTVNMDETTFSFSRKVLDRAMSIEMNEVMYDDFLSGKTENDIPQLIEHNEDLVVRPINGITVKDGDSQNVIDFLKDINDLLDGTPFKLGYRAANEALLYVGAAKRFGCNDWKIAMDDFTLMKILSRIDGDDSKLKTVSGEDLLNELSVLLTNKYSFCKSSKTIKKLNQMITILDRDKFVSFWG